MKESDTVFSDLDIYSSAQLIVDQYCDDAPIFAASQADKMLERGHLESMAGWHRIMAAVRVLLRPQPTDQDTLH